MPINPTPPAVAAPYTFQAYPKWISSKIANNADGTPRKVIVNSKEEEARHTGVEPEDIVIEAPPAPDPPKPYVPVEYPKWVSSQHKNGEKVIVKDHIEEAYHTGIPVDENGKVIVAEPEPLQPNGGSTQPPAHDPPAALVVAAPDDADF